MIYNLFEQSGTFKREEIKLGYQAVDIDILNNYNETDYQIDLFKAIEDCYDNKPSFFDNIKSDDFIFAFFPCWRFTEKIFLMTTTKSYGMKDWDNLHRLEYSMDFMNQINYYYSLFCKFYHILLKRNLRAIIENPYPGKNHHFLDLFFPFERTYIDKHRYLHGDYYNKPTGYWFINFEMKENDNNFLDLKKHYKNKFIIDKSKELESQLSVKGDTKELRSMISPTYAKWFIETFLVGNI